MQPPPEGIPPFQEAKKSEEDYEDRKAELFRSVKEASQEVLDSISEMQLEAAELLDRKLLPLSERELEIRNEFVSLLSEKLKEEKHAQEKFQKELQELLSVKPA